MNVVIRVNDEIKEKMIEYYKDKRRDKVIPYVVFQAEEEDTVITMYESGKVMFQGTSADVDAAMWDVQMSNTNEAKKEKINAFLNDVNEKITLLRVDQGNLLLKLSDLTSAEIQSKFGAPNLTILKNAVNTNSINLGYQNAKENKEGIDSFLKNLGFSSEDTSEDLYW